MKLEQSDEGASSFLLSKYSEFSLSRCNTLLACAAFICSDLTKTQLNRNDPTALMYLDCSHFRPPLSSEPKILDIHDSLLVTI